MRACSRAARDAGALPKVEHALETARKAGVEPIVAGEKLPGGYYRSASLHRLPDGVHHIAGYTDFEIFGPDLSIEVIDSDDEAIAVLEASTYGFVNAVFTGARDRFEQFVTRTKSGMLNRNRSTNLASPRLPFGGVGKSGNYRPAGAWAHRNVTAPLAVLENVIGAVTAHPQLAASLPAYDLDRLERQHTAEEAAETARTLIDTPRPMHLARPTGGHLPQSAALLARLYAGDRVPKEKKPPVIDHLRSAGPWAGVGRQRAALRPRRHEPDRDRRRRVFRGSRRARVHRRRVRRHAARQRRQRRARVVAAIDYANVLRQLVPGLPTSRSSRRVPRRTRKRSRSAGSIAAPAGDESARVRRQLSRPHVARAARDALAEQARAVRARRLQCTFAPFPVWDDAGRRADRTERVLRRGRDRRHRRAQRTVRRREGRSAARRRGRVARRVHDAIKTGEYTCVIIEPMQSEGGDRYATERFFRALRLLTRFHQTFLVFDEVQVGFGLGGPFAWHSKFRCSRARPAGLPDAVTFAKRRKVGV
jgi:hypothetical protein